MPLGLRISSLLILLATAAGAQQYDPYYVLPGPAGRIGADVALFNNDMGKLVYGSNILIMGKYSQSDELEVGAVADLGLLHDHASTLAGVQAGIKFGLAEQLALTGTVRLPVGDVDDVGLAIGCMRTFFTGEWMINTRASGAFLDGYTSDGVALSLLIEPVRAFGDGITGYLDVLIASNTDGVGDHLAIDIGPNADINLNERAIVNAGITFGLAGDARQHDTGLGLSLVMAF